MSSAPTPGRFSREAYTSSPKNRLSAEGSDPTRQHLPRRSNFLPRVHSMFPSLSSVTACKPLHFITCCGCIILTCGFHLHPPVSVPGETRVSSTRTDMSIPGFFHLLTAVTAHHEAEEAGTEEEENPTKRRQDTDHTASGEGTNSSPASMAETEERRWEAVPPNIPVHEAEQAVAALRSERIEVLREYQKQRQQWLLSRAASGITGGPPPSPQEIAFRGKRQRHRRNGLVELLSDHDVDQLQEASITYEPVPPPLQEYMEMINKVRRDRLNVQVEPAVAALPHPSIAYTPFHKEMAKQKAIEKKFRVHYLTGEGKKFPFFHNPEDDCYWKTQSDGTVSCVPMYDLTDKPRHDPAITVAVDQTGEPLAGKRPSPCKVTVSRRAFWTRGCRLLYGSTERPVIESRLVAATPA